MKLVVIESPYGALHPEGIHENVAYARAAMRDSIARGEAPIASHLLYTQRGILNDDDPAERTLGIELGFLWGANAHRIAFYLDRGWSRGMVAALDHWRSKPVLIAYRAFEPVKDDLPVEVGRFGRCRACNRNAVLIDGECPSCRH